MPPGEIQDHSQGNKRQVSGTKLQHNTFWRKAPTYIEIQWQSIPLRGCIKPCLKKAQRNCKWTSRWPESIRLLGTISLMAKKIKPWHTTSHRSNTRPETTHHQATAWTATWAHPVSPAHPTAWKDNDWECNTCDCEGHTSNCCKDMLKWQAMVHNMQEEQSLQWSLHNYTPFQYTKVPRWVPSNTISKNQWQHSSIHRASLQ